MQTHRMPDTTPYFLVFDKGDDVLAVLRSFAEANGVRGAAFTALGAFSTAVVAYWNKETKVYEQIPVDEQTEVLALVGDIGVHGEETRIHAHVTLGRRGGSTVGGHLIRATVFPTLEMHLTAFGATLARQTDEPTGLSLITGIR
jgi:predicted DNA-binding protein with PD1-like motif